MPPTYSVLANRRLAELGLDIMPTWQESLQTYLSARQAESVTVR